ncbi:MAG: ComEC/Rec2 family competence protein [Candidatus Fimenecus sp.]
MSENRSRIHFLNTGMSDCILLESNGHFALIDAAEDTDFPADKSHLNTGGYEQRVVDYLLNNCRGADGTVYLDFVLGTHAHSDHLGGFDTVILHPEICVGGAYLRPYDENKVFVMERIRWDNTEVYNQMMEALTKTKTPVYTDFDGKTVEMGDFKITFYYCGKGSEKSIFKYGENIHTVVTLAECNGTKALLAGDMNYKAGDERRIGNIVGKVDLLKVGHHGVFGSTSSRFLRKTAPKIAVVTNSLKRMYPDVRLKLRRSHTELHTTVEENGIIAALGANGEIKLKTDIHKE